jgi:hypothetical protein
MSSLAARTATRCFMEPRCPRFDQIGRRDDWKVIWHGTVIGETAHPLQVVATVGTTMATIMIAHYRLVSSKVVLTEIM